MFSQKEFNELVKENKRLLSLISRNEQEQFNREQAFENYIRKKFPNLFRISQKYAHDHGYETFTAQVTFAACDDMDDDLIDQIAKQLAEYVREQLRKEARKNPKIRYKPRPRRRDIRWDASIDASEMITRDRERGGM